MSDRTEVFELDGVVVVGEVTVDGTVLIGVDLRAAAGPVRVSVNEQLVVEEPGAPNT